MEQKQAKPRKIKSLKQPKLAAGFASRKAALEVLIAIERESVFANVALSNAFKKQGLSERDRAFVTALVQGVMRSRIELDERIDAVSNRPGGKIDVNVRNILRLGAFQILFMPNIPQQAVLNTATELAKVCGHSGLGKFTNGLLRNLARRAALSNDGAGAESLEGTATGNSVGNSTTAENNSLAEKYSMPDWLVDRWIANYGNDETIEILKFVQQPPALCIRTCELSITPEGLYEILERNGLTLRRSALVNACFIIERGRTTIDASNSGEPVVADAKPDAKTAVGSRKTAKSFRGSPEKLTGYAEGLFSIQDEAAAFVSLIVDPKSSDLVIDLCAAPGGKTLHMAEMMENRGRVIAVDQSASRLTPLKESRTRLGLKNIEIVAHDGRTFKSPILADKILVDAPCTGTGVINRRPDMRYKRKQEDLASLIELQRELLQNASQLVKPGGILIYATCSIEPEENFGNAKWFLDNFEEFEPDDIQKYLPKEILDECAPTSAGPACKTRIEDSCVHMVQLLPSRHKVSGFFIAKFRKRNPTGELT